MRHAAITVARLWLSMMQLQVGAISWNRSILRRIACLAARAVDFITFNFHAAGFAWNIWNFEYQVSSSRSNLLRS